MFAVIRNALYFYIFSLAGHPASNIYDADMIVFDIIACSSAIRYATASLDCAIPIENAGAGPIRIVPKASRLVSADSKFASPACTCRHMEIFVELQPH